MNLPVSLRAVQYYNFRLYFSGQTISLIGTWMQRIAVSWLVYSVTHSALMLGVVAFAGQIPVMLLPPYAGAGDATTHSLLMLSLLKKLP